MKKILILLICLTFVLPLFAQKVISGKSTATFINIKPVYVRGLPPNLYINLDFEDENKNGILEALENAKLILTISNKGKGPAQGLKVNVTDNIDDPLVNIIDGQEITFIYPNKSTTVIVELNAGMGIKSAEHKLEINVLEYYGYDTDPAFLIVNTLQYQEPKLVFSGLDIIDVGDGTSALIEDGQIQPGEQVKVKLLIQNVGQNVSKDSKYSILVDDKNIFIPQVSGNLGDIGIGEVKEIWFAMSPNKRVTSSSNLAIKLTISNSLNRGGLYSFQLPLAINKKPPVTNIVTIQADLERLQTQVARFVYKSDRISTNIANIIDIKQAPLSSLKHPNAIGIIMGIEKYEYFTPATYAVNDAAIIKEYFINSLGIDITKVWEFTNEKVNGNFFDNKFNPTYGELQKAVIKGVTEVYVFFSGHGIPSKTGDRVYLLSSDGRVEALERQGYDLSTFYQSLDSLNAKSVTVFIDACFSGMSKATESYESKNLIASKGARIKPQIMQPWLTNPNFSVFSSSDFDQTSLGFDGSETGLFTYYLCAGLQGRADANADKSLTYGELSDYIITGVKETSIKIRGLQSPQFNGNRDKVLVTY